MSNTQKTHYAVFYYVAVIFPRGLWYFMWNPLVLIPILCCWRGLHPNSWFLQGLCLLLRPMSSSSSMSSSFMALCSTVAAEPSRLSSGRFSNFSDQSPLQEMIPDDFRAIGLVGWHWALLGSCFCCHISANSITVLRGLWIGVRSLTVPAFALGVLSNDSCPSVSFRISCLSASSST